MPRREAGASRPGREAIQQNLWSQIPPNNASNATRRGKTRITYIQPTSRERERRGKHQTNPFRTTAKNREGTRGLSTLRRRRLSAIDRNNRRNCGGSTPSAAIKARTMGSSTMSSTEGSGHWAIGVSPSFKVGVIVLLLNGHACLNLPLAPPLSFPLESI